MPDHTAARNKRVASLSKITPRLYLTCLATASDEIQLANLGITHVVSVIEDAPSFPPTFPLRTLHVSVSDYTDEDILTHLPATTSFIRSALAESPSNRVLVHCFMGISRSATVVIAYLIATTKMTPREALAAVRAERAIVRPNRGFMSQLQEYHSKHSDSLQASLADEPPDKNGTRGKQKALPGYNTWSPKDAAKVYMHNALAAATSLPSAAFLQQRLAGWDYRKFESHIS